MSEAATTMQAAAKAVERELPKGYGFFILAFRFGETDEKAQYVSNTHNRESIVKAMLEFIERNPLPKIGDN